MVNKRSITRLATKQKRIIVFTNPFLKHLSKTRIDRKCEFWCSFIVNSAAMYQKKDDLSDLIQSLSYGENRYLDNAFGSDISKGDQPMYLKLYRSIKDKKSRISESDPNNRGKVLTDNKRFLYKHILRNLRGLHEELSVNIILNNKLSDIEIIYNHGLSEQAMVILNKAQRVAREQEKFSHLLQLLDWEKRLAISVNKPLRLISSINMEEVSVLQKMLQINNLLGLYSRIMLLKKEHGYVKGSVRKELEQEIIYSPNFPALEDCLSEKARFYYNLILSIYYWMTFQHLKEFESSKALLNEQVHKILISDYLAGILQHITSCVCLIRFKDALEGLRLSRNYIEKYYTSDSNPYKQQYTAYYISYSLIIYTYQGQLAKLSEVLFFAERKLPECTSFTEETRSIVLGNMMNAYMAIGEMDKAERTWATLFYEIKDLRKDIYADLFIFRLFFLLQTGEYSLLESTARSALRYYGNAENYRFEYPLALLFNKAHHYEDKKMLSALLEQCISMVNNFIIQLNLPLLFQEHYSRYIIWTEAILLDIPYYDSAQKWYLSWEANAAD